MASSTNLTQAKPAGEVVSLREHFERILDEERIQREIAFTSQATLMQQKFDSLQRAVDKAETDQDRRNILNNEFRGQLKDQAATFITREYIEQALKNVNEKLVGLQGFRSNLEGRMWAIGVGFALLNLLISGFGLLH